MKGRTVNPAPGEGKKTVTGAVKKKGWTREDWVRRADEAGIADAEKLSIRDIRSRLKKLKEDGVLVDDPSRFGGGRREGSGRKEISKEPEITEMKSGHLMEEVEIVIADRTTGAVKSTRKKTLLAILDMLRQEALKNKSIPAAKEYFDRTLGRPKQEIGLSGTIKVKEQKVPSAAERAASNAYAKSIKEELEEESDEEE